MRTGIQVHLLKILEGREAEVQAKKSCRSHLRYYKAEFLLRVCSVFIAVHVFNEFFVCVCVCVGCDGYYLLATDALPYVILTQTQTMCSSHDRSHSQSAFWLGGRGHSVDSCGGR